MDRLSLSGGTLRSGDATLLEGLDPAFSLKGSFLSVPATGEAERVSDRPRRVAQQKGTGR